MNIIIRKNFSKIFYFFIFFLFFFHDEILIQDTGSYIENIYKRPFLYPFIINIFELISATAFLKLLSIFQLILGYICLIYFSFFFIKKFNINNILYHIILIFTVAYPYLGISMKLGLTIQQIFIVFLKVQNLVVKLDGLVSQTYLKLFSIA